MCIALVSGYASPVMRGRADGAIGRTGRAGKLGTAITFLTNDDDEVMWVFFEIHSLRTIFADELDIAR